MKNIVENLLQEYIKKNETGNIAEMTIGELTCFVAGFIKNLEESVEHAIANMKVSDLANFQKSVSAVACNKSCECESEDEHQAMLDRIAYARKCRLEKIAQRKEAEKLSAETYKPGRRRDKDFKPLRLYKRVPRKVTSETYAVYDRINGKRVNIMYAHVPAELDKKKGITVLKRSYAMETGVNYLNVSCCRLDNTRKEYKLSANATRY